MAPMRQPRNGRDEISPAAPPICAGSETLKRTNRRTPARRAAAVQQGTLEPRASKTSSRDETPPLPGFVPRTIRVNFRLSVLRAN